MKTNLILFGLVLSLVSSLVFSQQEVTQNELPVLVASKFKATCPKAADQKWILEDYLYVVEYKDTNSTKDREIWFNNMGGLTKIREAYTSNELPKPILDIIKKDYSTYIIDAADKIQLVDVTTTTYVVELKGETDEVELTFDIQGRLIKKNLEEQKVMTAK